MSGEPQNWLFSERDDDCTMIEDGSIAKAALCGCAQGFEEPPEPLEGEVLLAAPVAPAAPQVIPKEVREAVESMAALYETNGIYDDADILRKWLAAPTAPGKS